MKPTILTSALLLFTVAAFAEQPPLPYATGGVIDFLKTNKSNGTPSVVLYNFNLESG
ncbi:MAG: hypothetical protein HOB73_02585 [Planctomycetaceae bacterium]|nr:hypothetical protein [Planctomycetaceae bacterium]